MGAYSIGSGGSGHIFRSVELG